ncbi:MAG: 50S ribosomal protein L15 [Endozoicomonadaceae bacterium]|nr:50S ribosomal protein L15 [Endozoicomonadaceae bacterium]MCY4330728.1 50S ribosomal protein L15 [Endozoicomonadaceae bacterium]
MKLNALSPAPGSNKERKRKGRGIGSGLGKTCGRGHKGQKSRTGGGVKPGFEGGQQPLQRRLPKFGFFSARSQVTAEVRLNQLSNTDTNEISLETLKKAGLIQHKIKYVKIILSGKLDKAVTIKKLGITKGARAAVEAAGGTVES